MNRSLCLAVLAGVLVFPLYSQEHPADESQYPHACDDAKSQQEMNQCNAQEARKADDRLNRVYNRLLGTMQGDEKSIIKLKAAERAWIQYRDAHCEAAGAQYEGGSMRPMMISECLWLTTRHRIEELKAAYENGDIKLE